MKNESQELILLKKNLRVILASFSNLHWITIDKIAIIYEQIKLFSNLSEISRKRVKLIFLLFF